MKSDNKSRAEEHFAKTLELDPDCAEAHYYLGRLLYDKASHDAARQHLAMSLELDPRSSHAADAHFILGSLAVNEAGDGEASPDARAHFEEYLALDPDGPRAEEAKMLLVTLGEKERR